MDNNLQTIFTKRFIKKMQDTLGSTGFLFKLIEIMDKNNMVYMSQDELANMFYITRTSVNINLKKLEQNGYIKFRRKKIMVNPTFAYKCDINDIQHMKSFYEEMK